MSSKKNVGRKRLGRLQIAGTGNGGCENDKQVVKRPFQLQSKCPDSKPAYTLVQESQNIKDDLSFSSSFACDMESDLDLMHALDKMEKEHVPDIPNMSTRQKSSGRNEHRKQKFNRSFRKSKESQNEVIVMTPRGQMKVTKGDNEFKNPLNVSATSFDSLALYSPVDVSTPVVGKQTRSHRSTRHSAVKNNWQQVSSQITDRHSERKRKKESQSLRDTSEKTASESKVTDKEKENKNKLTVKNSEEEIVRNEFFQSLLIENDSLDITLDREVPHISPKSNQIPKSNHSKNGSETENSKNSKNQVSDTTKTTEDKNLKDLKSKATFSESSKIFRKPSTNTQGETVQNSPVEQNRRSNQNSSSIGEDRKEAVNVTDRSITTVIRSEELALSSWGLPDPVLKQYRQRGITHMFEWQTECLLTGNVLGGGNLVYSAPTSAGKTMVAELLVLKKVMETRKKAIIILPFVSVTREKMFYLQELYQDAGIRVSGFMGHYSPAGGFSSVDVAVCTIEKGNGLINRLLEENKLDKLGIIVVDELHLIGDPHRGYLLELLLTKISYMGKKRTDKAGEDAGNPIQIVGMSATLPNLDLLANWLNADLYRTDYRPVPLLECMKIGTAIYNSDMEIIRDVNLTYKVKGDTEHVVPLCIETIREGHSILIFCPTKNWCEKLSETIAREFYNLLKNPDVATASVSKPKKSSDVLVLPLNPASLRDIVEQLRRTPIGLDQMLGRTVPYGVAYHHAGLTFDERDIVEGAFRQGILKVLVATSTLSSGVNLPARRVLIRTPVFHGGKVIDFLTYKQMIGRAGRKGVDTAGESILLCKPTEKSKAVELVTGQLPPVKSTLIRHEGEELSSSMKRAILEVVVSGVTMETNDVASYASCTLLAASLPSGSAQTQNLIDKCIKFLQENEFVCKQTVTNEDGSSTERFIPTQLGAAVLASSLSPDEGLVVFSELQRARQCFVLENELHIIYQVTPIYSGIGDYIDWYQFFCIWENLSPGMRKVAEIIGVKESFLAKSVRGRVPCKTAAQHTALAIHKRFYTALVLHDLVQEVPLSDVAKKFNCNKGQLQSLQQSAATFAGMVTVFCARLGWSNLELILSQFQNRLTFGVQRELCDLVRISTLNGQRARVLYNGGYQTVAALASAHPADVEALLKNSAPFQSTKKQETETEWEAEERRKSRCIFLTGRKGVTENEAAVIIIDEAKAMIQDELGGLGIQWNEAANRTSKVEHPSPVVTSPVSLQQCSRTASRRSSSRKRKSSSIGEVDQTKRTAERDSPALLNRKSITPGRQELSRERSCVLSPPLLSCKNPQSDNVKLKVESGQANIMKNESESNAEKDMKSAYKSNLPDGNKDATSDSTLRKKKEKSQQEKGLELMNGSKDTQIKHVSDTQQRNCVVQNRVSNSIQGRNHSGIAGSPLFSNASSGNKEAKRKQSDYLTNSQKQKSVEANYCATGPKSIEDKITANVSRNNKIGDEETSDESKSSSMDMKGENKQRQLSEVKRKKLSEQTEVECSKPVESAGGSTDVDDEFLETFVLDTQTAKSVICGIAKSVGKNTSNNGFIGTESRDSQKSNHVFDDLNSEALFSEKIEDGSYIDRDDINPKDENSIKVNNSIDDDLQLKLSESYESERNDLEVNVFQESNEEMFENSVDIIAASNYERVCLSGETSNYKDRLNCSYEDLHIPYQSGQEVCFEKADKENGGHVEIDVNVHYDKGRCLATNNLGLFSSPKTMNDANDFQKENDISFSSTFNLSDVNVDALSEHVIINKKKVNDLNQCSDDLKGKNDQCAKFTSKAKNSQKDKDHFGDSLTVSMIDQVFDSDKSALSNPEKNSLAKQDCDRMDQKLNRSEKFIVKDLLELDLVTPGECKVKSNSGTTRSKEFVTPKVRAIKRGRQTPIDRDAKVLKKADMNHSTPEAERMDKMRKHTNQVLHPVHDQEKNLNLERNKTYHSSCEKKISRTEDKQAGKTTVEEQDQSPSIHNVSTGSDCVPPTPPSEDQLGTATTPKRTPLRSLNALAFSPRLETLAKQDKAGIFDKKDSNAITDLKTTACITEGKNSIDDEEDNCSEEEDTDKLCPSFIDPEDLGVPLTQASFAIIDVCADKRLFKTFIMEWRTKSRYAISVACEKKPQNQSKDVRIGAKYRKDMSSIRLLPNDSDGITVEDSDLVIVGIAVSWENRDAYYVSFTHNPPNGDVNDSLAAPPSDLDISIGIRTKAVKSVLQQAVCKDLPVSIVMFDVKAQYRTLAEGCGFVPKGKFEDPKIACWILDPSARERTLHGMTTNLLPSEVHMLQGLGGGIGVGSVGLSPDNPGSGRYRACTECVLVRHLAEYFRACLDKEELFNVYTEVEMQAAVSLCNMELNGFGFSQEESESQKSVMIAKLSALEEQAYNLAGHPFSLSATDDIAQVLYFELKLPVSGDPSSGPAKSLAPRGIGARKGRMKNWYSTSKDILEKLKKLHPLPGVILEWRRITNALTKVVFPLQKKKVRCENLKMYRIFSECQLHSATGRVSLSEPNLQNVPKDFDIVMPDIIGESPSAETVTGVSRRTRGSSKLQQMIGVKQVAKVTDENCGTKFSVSMRHAFIPFEGGILLAADYSQLELRMIAYLSNDEKLINVLNEDGDVFKLITAQWKKITADEVTPEQRAQAKQVCYGMIYGIGPKALGEQLEVDENDAAAFIESFKARYPGMRSYLRKTVELCRQKGYVQTMVGRKRYLQSITSTNPHARAQAERQAVNTTVQGSAADLVKKAMVKIDKQLEQRYPLSQYSHKQKLPNKHPARQRSTPDGAYLVLQLHDELIYEVNQAHLKEVAIIVKTCMEKAIELPIKMPVKIKVGQSWGTLEEMEV